MSKTMAQSGIDALNNRRTRRTRQAPPPRHPATPTPLAVVPDKVDDPAPAPVQATPARPEPVVDVAAEQSPPPAEKETKPHEPVASAASTSADTPEPVATAPAPVEPAADEETGGELASPDDKSGKESSTTAAKLPVLDIDLRDPEAQIVSPTVMSIPESIVARFDKARSKAPSHTAVVLNALRKHAHELPALILARRPGPNPGDLFPWRDAPGDSGTETPLPLRIRPTKAELKVMKTLQDWSTKQIRAQRPGARETNRSEMVAAALDAYLPAGPGPGKKQK
ncbi:hypothetical protein [Mycolicibacterium mageritense]|uniref:hypothetical protein n=1 Tax=Mycolicibacterium mageritense TaxID=53462 RepID=UPI001E469628|nr:hypothetical protein [Mycolicibacterium mageritense]GJJ21957.1 hypothetical protein MTY414_56300 [Mycolicibacterium mageritense]